MRLTGIFLYPDLVEFRSEAARSFAFQARFVCHYVQRFVAARKLQTEGFSKICVIGKSVASASCFKSASKALLVDVPLDLADYEDTPRDGLPEYFLSLLEQGLRKASLNEQLPAALFEEAAASFRALGYRNRWVHAAKAFRAHGLACRLLCELDLSAFRLMLEVKRGDTLLVSREILRAQPDEIIYAHRFKDLVLEDGILRVKDKFGGTLCELDVP